MEASMHMGSKPKDLLIGLALVACFLIITFIFWLTAPDAKPTTVSPSTPTISTRDAEIALVISECSNNAVDASAAPLLIMGGEQEVKREQASFHDAFWMLTVATAAESDLPPDDSAGRQHVENIRNLFRAYDTEFRKPRIDLDRARRVRRLMEQECDDLQALTKKS